MRTFLKLRLGKSVPIQAIGLQLYAEDGPATMDRVEKTQWLDYSSLHLSLSGQAVLIVDEVSSSFRAHLSFTAARGP